MTPRYTTTTNCKDIHAGKKETKTGGPGFWAHEEEHRKGLMELYDLRLDDRMLEVAIAEVNTSAATTSVMSGLQGFVQPQAILHTENADASLARM